MTSLIDGRPAGLDAFFRPGDPFTVELTWPAGYLTGRTFTATLDGDPLALAVNGDVMAVTASGSQTAAAAVRGAFVLTETTSGAQDVLVGSWAPSTQPAASSRLEVTVAEASASVAVTVGAVDARFHRQFIHIPTGWGRSWHAARASAQSGGLARVVHLGDSIAVGWIATPTWLSGYGTLVGDALRDAYGNGGTGFYGVDFARHSGNNLVAGIPVTTTGSWTTVTGISGPNAHAVRPTVAGNGATMTFTIDSGTTISIYSMTDPAYGRYDYSLDGGSAVQVPQNAAAAVQVTNINTTAGSHTVQITAASGDCRIFGVKSEKASGVAYHNMSVAGRQIDDLVTTSGALAATLSATGNPDLLVVTLGINDINTAGRTEAEVLAWMDTILRTALNTNLADPPDLVVVIEHRGNAAFGDINGVWTGVYSALRRAAERYGAALIDVWAEGRRSWDVWAARGLWANGNNATHPSNAGHQVMADLLNEVLLS